MYFRTVNSQWSALVCQQSTFHWPDPVSQWAGESCTGKGTITTRICTMWWGSLHLKTQKVFLNWSFGTFLKTQRGTLLCFSKETFQTVHFSQALNRNCKITYSHTRQVRLWHWLIIDVLLDEINNWIQLLHRDLSLPIYLLSVCLSACAAFHPCGGYISSLCSWIPLPPPFPHNPFCIISL